MVKAEMLPVGKLRRENLPPEAPPNVVVSPSMNRWVDDSNGSQGSLPRLVNSVQRALSREKMDKDTWMIIADASNKPDVHAARLRGLANLDPDRTSRIFLLTNETQAEVMQALRHKLRIREEVLNAVLLNTGYASQRQKLDVVVASLVLNGNGEREVHMLTLDDDTVVPEQYGVVKKEVLESMGFQRKPNSQVLLPGVEDPLSPDIFEVHDNKRIGSFFEDLGRTVGEIRKGNKNLRATYSMIDTMPSKLDESTKGKPSQFVVSYDPEADDIPQASAAEAIAATAIKTGKPDYPARKVLRAALELGLPDEEVPIKSFPSGPNEKFAYMKCPTNIVDSACLSRKFDNTTGLLPWWYVSSLDISLSNPLRTVTSHYRADNDMLPVLLTTIFDQTKKPYVYLSGIEAQVVHHRSQQGYRPNVLEQATASMIGNIAALEAAQCLQFDPHSGKASLYIPDNGSFYKAPEERVNFVFEEMQALSTLCATKIAEFTVREGKETDLRKAEQMNNKIVEYARIQSSIAQKMGDFNLSYFERCLSQEIGAQLKFYRDVLDAMPSVLEQVQNLVKDGQYPVLEFVKQ